MTTVSIRKATPDDCACILNFIIDLAVYEREPDAVLATKNDIHNALFCEAPKVFALIAESHTQGESPKSVGFAMYFYNYSTWLGKLGIYLEDLYVDPAARGQGAGKALLKAIAQIALDEGCGRYDWSVLRWNTPSIEFYEAYGAKAMDEWVGYRMDRAAMEAFVAES